MAAAKAAKIHGDDIYGTKYIHQFEPGPTYSQNAIIAAGVPRLRISSHGSSLKWSRGLFQLAWE